MVQKCSLLNVLNVFFIEPTTIHFIKEIGKEINLAHTSVRNNIIELAKLGLIKKKEAKPFNGYIANREEDKFLFYKRVYNLYSLYDLKEKIIEDIQPKAIILFGSYSLGEDIETSDIDLIVLSKVRKELKLKKFELLLKRRINIIIADNIEKLDENIIKKVYNGIVLYGGL